jgi:hypothetical protein
MSSFIASWSYGQLFQSHYTFSFHKEPAMMPANKVYWIRMSMKMRFSSQLATSAFFLFSFPAEQ